MEPQDTPPYAPLDGEVAAPASDHSTSTPTARTDPAPAPDERIRTRRLVAVAAGASFLAAMTGMAIARSGSSSASTTSNDTTPQVTVDDGTPVAPSFDDGIGGEPRAAQPAVPF